MVETTALGAAYLAGLAAGLYASPEAVADAWRPERRFEPQTAAAERRAPARGLAARGGAGALSASRFALQGVVAGMFASENGRREAGRLAGNEQRRAQIVDLVRQQGFVSIEALAQRSPSPRRRSAATSTRCATQACCSAIMAAPASPPRSRTSPIPTGRSLCIEEKRRIAQLVAGHIPDHASLFINIGTTTEEVARALLRACRPAGDHQQPQRGGLLCGKPDFEVIVAGGVVRRARPRHRRRGHDRPDPPVPGRFRRHRDQRHRSRRHAARLRLPGGPGGAGDHRQLAPGLPRRRPHQVRPQRPGAAGRRSSEVDALFTDAPPPPALRERMRGRRGGSCTWPTRPVDGDLTRLIFACER